MNTKHLNQIKPGQYVVAVLETADEKSLAVYYERCKIARKANEFEISASEIIFGRRVFNAGEGRACENKRAARNHCSEPSGATEKRPFAMLVCTPIPRAQQKIRTQNNQCLQGVLHLSCDFLKKLVAMRKRLAHISTMKNEMNEIITVEEMARTIPEYRARAVAARAETVGMIEKEMKYRPDLRRSEYLTNLQAHLAKLDAMLA